MIGDCVNTFGILRDLSKIEPLEVKHSAEAKWFYDLLPKELNIKSVDEVDDNAIELDLIGAFRYSEGYKYHMSQCYHQQFGLPTPSQPIKPELDVPNIEVPIYDYILTPFSRSLPEYQKWGLHRWQELSWDLNKNKYSTCIFGNSLYDPKINGLQMEYDRPMVEVLNMIKKCRKGVISVITGISHLSYAMDAKNCLLSGQGVTGWGINPNATIIDNPNVCEISVKEVLEVLI